MNTKPIIPRSNDEIPTFLLYLTFAFGFLALYTLAWDCIRRMNG